VLQRRIFTPTYWDLLESFLEAQRNYRQIHLIYETKVLAHADEQCVDRHSLRLNATEVSALLDFNALGALRSGALWRTKNISHALFRSKGRTHKFDRHVSEIFHELSILREEQYKVSTFAEEYRLDNELDLYESFLDEVHEDFPRRVHHIHGLFSRGQMQLENVLRSRTRDPIYLRSLTLFGDSTLRDAYPDGVISHCWRVFDGGPLEAFFQAGRSFAGRGFKREALDALNRGLEFADDQPPFGVEAKVDLAAIAEQAKGLRGFIQDNSPADLVGQLRGQMEEAEYGDAAAPDIGEDFTSGDTTQLEEAEVV
jgi:hypothetical protein